MQITGKIGFKSPASPPLYSNPSLSLTSISTHEHTKINKLHSCSVCQEHILSLHIPVEHTACMQVDQPSEDLMENIGHDIFTQSAPTLLQCLDQVSHRTSRTVLQGVLIKVTIKNTLNAACTYKRGLDQPEMTSLMTIWLTTALEICESLLPPYSITLLYIKTIIKW